MTDRELSIEELKSLANKVFGSADVVSSIPGEVASQVDSNRDVQPPTKRFLPTRLGDGSLRYPDGKVIRGNQLIRGNNGGPYRKP